MNRRAEALNSPAAGIGGLKSKGRRGASDVAVIPLSGRGGASTGSSMDRAPRLRRGSWGFESPPVPLLHRARGEIGKRSRFLTCRPPGHVSSNLTAPTYF